MTTYSKINITEAEVSCISIRGIKLDIRTITTTVLTAQKVYVLTNGDVIW